MEFHFESWNPQRYQQLMDFLEESSEPNYQKFQRRLIPESAPILGVRSPILKKTARSIAKGNWGEYFSLAKGRFYEEALLQGLVLGFCDESFPALLERVSAFVGLIDNWAICDMTAGGLKQFQKNRAEGFPLLQKMTQSENPWEIRFGLILMLSHYLCDPYIDFVLESSASVQSDHYYVRMGNAWLISTAFVRYPDKTKSFLISGLLDDWTYQKALQKIVESTRVDSVAKEWAREQKRKGANDR